jgi:hypothetical protein
MHSNFFTVLSALAFLGTIGLLGLTLAVLVWALATRRSKLGRGLGLGAAALAGLYVLVWLGVGLASPTHVLPISGEKYFCELDCHLAYSVASVQPANGYVLVTVRTRFDSTTIAPWRPREAPVWPAPRRLVLVDDQGGQHLPAADQAAALGSGGSSGTPLTRELRPGESYTTTIAFALPAGVSPAGLVVETDMLVDQLLIGDERSPFHGKTVLGLTD